METERKSNAVFRWRWVGAGCCISRIWAAISFPPFTSLSLSLPLPLSAGVWGTQGQALSCHLPPPFSLCPSPAAHLPNREQSPYRTTHGTHSHETPSRNIQHTDINIPPEECDQLNPEVYRGKRKTVTYSTWTKVTYRTYSIKQSPIVNIEHK